MKSLFGIFKKGLQKTATAIGRGFESLFKGSAAWTPETYERLEASLLGADFGVKFTTKLVEEIRDNYDRGLIKTAEDIHRVARARIVFILQESGRVFDTSPNPEGPRVVMLVGVNGSGKTTTAGRLAHILKEDGRKVVLAACDTFRAAATEQLKLWGARLDVQVVAGQHGSDPSSVAFDATSAALSRKADFLLIDTAGRQHSRKNLMDELSKMKRSVAKVMPSAPHEVWLVVDAAVGSNALAQAREFGRAGGVNGLIFTKLDGTAKGGMVVAIKQEFALPVLFVGLGEGPEDLQPFDPEKFADAVLPPPA